MEFCARARPTTVNNNTVNVKIRDRASPGPHNTYDVSVPRHSSIADTLIQFFDENLIAYPFRYAAAVVVDGAMISKTDEMRQRIEHLGTAEIEILPYVPEVESVLRRWIDRSRRRHRRRGGGA